MGSATRTLAVWHFPFSICGSGGGDFLLGAKTSRALRVVSGDKLVQPFLLPQMVGEMHHDMMIPFLGVNIAEIRVFHLTARPPEIIGLVADKKIVAFLS
jgi:hypothetical protein